MNKTKQKQKYKKVKCKCKSVPNGLQRIFATLQICGHFILRGHI